MQTYALLTRHPPKEARFGMDHREHLVADSISMLPEAHWVANYAVPSPWDYIDIFEAPDMQTAMKVSDFVRHSSGAHTEIWPGA